MLCAAGVDRAVYEDFSSISAALDRARDDGIVLQLYAHAPGSRSDPARLEAIAAGAADRGLASYTYAELADDPPPGPGLALSLDDADVEAWTTMAPVFARYELRVTFFVTRYHQWTADQRAQLRALAAAGHDIEAHAVNHLRGPDAVDDHGMTAYLRDEVVPSIDRLRADGYPTRVFAYPYGARTPAIDRAVLAHVDRVRSVSFSTDNFAVVDPCPE